MDHKYKEALERCKKEFNFNNIAYSHEEIKQRLERVFPELKDSEDERIRKEIIEFLIWLKEFRSEGYEPSGKYVIEDMIAWLEKQGEQKPQGKQALEVWKDMRLEVYQQASGNRHESNYSDDSTKMFSLIDIDEIFEKVAEKQGEQNIKMIQWKGDNLRKVVKFTGKSPKFNEWFKTWDDYESYVHSHGNIFKLFCEDGSHYEVPVGAWIVKTPDGYNVASKATYKQKIKPKFKVGDWVLVCDETPCQIEKVMDLPGNHFQYWTTDGTWWGDGTKARLWTIQDAKDGDVLANNGNIILFKEISNSARKDYKYIKSHCLILAHSSDFYTGGSYNLNDGFHPAIKEQRDLLFQKIEEAGYEWNAEKKEIKKIERNLTWSEEDEKFFKTALWHISHSISNGKSTNINCDTTEWLKSLKARIKRE